MINRRGLIVNVQALAAVTLIEAAVGAKALSTPPSRAARRWIEEQQSLSADLRAGRLRQAAWQTAVEQLGAGLDRTELLEQLDFERLRATFDFRDGTPAKRIIRLGPEMAAPKLSYGLAFFGFRRGQAITPHGHRNMVSAHMAVAGTFRARTFDRVADENDALILRSSGDRRMRPGDISSMSSERDNIHWFVAEQDHAATLDVIIDNLDPLAPEPYVIDLVDPDGGSRRGDGTMRAPRIDWAASLAKYGQAA